MPNNPRGSLGTLRVISGQMLFKQRSVIKQWHGWDIPD
jgi:hypothetical protein